MTTRSLAEHYRAAYAKLPPAMQLVGLQLWMPLMFVSMFCLCYIGAFHAPAVRDAPVAVVGRGDVTALRQATGTAFDYHAVASRAAAEGLVRRGSDIAALDIQVPTQPVLVIASAHSYQAASIAKQAFTPIAAAQHVTLTVKDLAPLPAHDSFGMTTMYLSLAWCIGGYMLAMFLALMGGPLRHRVRFTAILVGGGLLALLSLVIAGPVLGAVRGHLLTLWAIGWCWMSAIGLATNGFSYFFGRFVALPAMATFVFLSVPSSGAAYPAFMLPHLFQLLHPYVVGFGITEMIKHTLYGVGEPSRDGFVLLASYAVLGVVLSLVGKLLRERREVRRILAGRTTMFMDAQAAMRDHSIAQREAVLERFMPVGPATHRLAVASQQHTATLNDSFAVNALPMDGIEDVDDVDDPRRP